MRQLIVLLFRVFAVLYSTELHGEEAGNRFEVMVVEFLDCVDKVGRALHPEMKKPVWLSKYGILGLLRCRRHFMDYTYLHSLYEGNIEGEGMVKELRPLCPNAVKSKWPLNLMNTYNRQNMLACLAKSIPSSSLVPPTSLAWNANCRRYKSWSDVIHSMEQEVPISLIVLQNVREVQCYVMIHMFQTSYLRQLVISPTNSYADKYGFVYHHIILDLEEHVFEVDTKVSSYGILLPNHWKTNDEKQYAVVDKEWRYVDANRQWTHF